MVPRRHQLTTCFCLRFRLAERRDWSVHLLRGVRLPGDHPVHVWALHLHPRQEDLLLPLSGGNLLYLWSVYDLHCISVVSTKYIVKFCDIIFLSIRQVLMDDGANGLKPVLFTKNLICKVSFDLCGDRLKTENIRKLRKLKCYGLFFEFLFPSEVKKIILVQCSEPIPCDIKSPNWLFSPLFHIFLLALQYI